MYNIITIQIFNFTVECIINIMYFLIKYLYVCKNKSFNIAIISLVEIE